MESQVFKGLASSDEKFSNTPIYRTNKNVDRMDWITVSFLNADKLDRLQIGQLHWPRSSCHRTWCKISKFPLSIPCESGQALLYRVKVETWCRSSPDQTVNRQLAF